MSAGAAGTPVRRVRWQGDAAVVEVVGDVDLGRAPELQKALLEVADRRPSRIVVDLGGVAYMDSSGVASLVKLLSRTRRCGIHLSLAALTQRVRGVFEITRLDEVFDIRPTAEEALA